METGKENFRNLKEEVKERVSQGRRIRRKYEEKCQ